jgi:DNA-binding response OmpR family regulator
MNTPLVLVVDDDPSILNFIKPNLEARGYKVVTASTGEDAILVAQKEKPDLIILDIMMPEMDGFEACRKIRAFTNVPILMFSAREGENDNELCAACGATTYLTKPLVLRELLELIKTLLK